MKRENINRVLAALLCAVLLTVLLPTTAMATEPAADSGDTYTADSDVMPLDNDTDTTTGSGITIEDEAPNTEIVVIPSDANALILMDTGAQSPKGVPGQVVKVVLPLAVNKEYLPSEKYMLRNINIYPDVPTDTSISNWPFELIYASDVQHLKDMSYNSTAEVWYEFKISEFASKGRYAVPFKVNATVWREDAVNGTSITEDVTFNICAYVTVTDDGSMSGVTTSFGSLQVAGTNVGGSYTVPTGSPNQSISMRIPVINVGGTLTNVTVYPVVSTSLDEFPFVVTSTNYGKYFSYWASGEVKYLDYTFTVSPYATSGNKSIKFKATYFENSAAAEGSFSTQFTVIDGYDASAMSVMVKEYKLYVDDTEVSGLMAGEETELRLTLVNNSTLDTAKKVIASLVFTNSPGLTLCVGGTDTAYADSIKAGGTATLKYKIMAKQDAEVGPAMLGISLTYETTEAVAGKASQNIMLPISQKMDVVAGTPEIYGSPSGDKETTISVPLTNMGRAKALNIRVMATDGMTASTPAYVGDLLAGGSTSADITVGFSKVGAFTGKLIVQFEDANGQSYSETVAVPLSVAETSADTDADAAGSTRSSTGSRLWLWLLFVILLLILIGIIVYVIIRYNRGEIGPNAGKRVDDDDTDDFDDMDIGEKPLVYDGSDGNGGSSV